MDAAAAAAAEARACEGGEERGAGMQLQPAAEPGVPSAQRLGAERAGCNLTRKVHWQGARCKVYGSR